MNNSRRKEIAEVVAQLNICKSRLQSILAAEEDVRDSLEEYFSGTERFEISDEACDLLEDAIENLEDIC